MSDDLAEPGRPDAAVPERPAPDFRAVFDASPRPLLLMAADPPKFTMLAVNRAHAFAFATTPQALEGFGVLEVFPADAPPEVADFVDAIRASLERVIANRAADQMAVRPYAVQQADGASEERYWSAINAPVLGAGGEVTHIVSAVQDVTGEVLERRSEEARQLLMREVDHRARNALAIVQSFVRLTRAPDLEAFRRILDGRVEALARAQTSLAARRWEGASLREVVEAELASLSQGSKFEVSGPQVLLPPEHVQAMSMVLHELATNAAKYGALSNGLGRISVCWQCRSHDKLSAARLLEWQEVGGPPVAAPTTHGYGTSVIRDLIPHELGGFVDLAFTHKGVLCRIGLPAKWVDLAGI